MKKIFVLLIPIFCFYGCKSLNTESETAFWGSDPTDTYAQILVGEKGLYGYMLRQYCNDKTVLSYKNGELHALYTHEVDESNKTLIKKPNTLWERWIGCDYNTEVCNNKDDTFYFSNKYQRLTQTPDYIMVEEYSGNDSIEDTREKLESFRNGYETQRLGFMKLDIRNPNSVTKTTHLATVTQSKTELCSQFRKYLNEEYGSFKVMYTSKKSERLPFIQILESGDAKFKQNNAEEDTLSSEISHSDTLTYTSWLGTVGFSRDVGFKFTSHQQYCSTGKEDLVINNTTQKVDCKKIKNVVRTFNLKEFHVIGKK